MIALPAMLMKPQNPLYTDAQRLESWNRYEVDAWAHALRFRGLSVRSLDSDIQRALLARLDEGPRKAVGA